MALNVSFFKLVLYPLTFMFFFLCSIAALGEYLIDGDPENKLRKAVEEVRPKDHAECKRLATKYCDQLYQIYLNKEDRLFLPICKF